jgi:hypothetical protein
MNERIQELILKASETVDIYNPDTGITHYREFFDKEKFAELLIRECARVFWTIDSDELHQEYVKALKKHFGIEK